MANYQASLENVEDFAKQLSLVGFNFRRNNAPQLYLTASRKHFITIPLRINNSDLCAGSCMIFYCEHCGWPSDILNEGYLLAEIRKACSECEGLKKRGWLEEAAAQVGMTKP